jgi:dihydrofolate reductase
MRKIRIMEHISLDGVIQQSADENDFPYGAWTAPYRTPAGRDAILAAYGESYDLLLGRRTYDMWSGFWPKAPSSPMADRLNAATKYIATHRQEGLAWGPAETLGSDIVVGIRRIKAQDGPDVILSGSSTLTSTLLEHGLADEVLLVVFPVLLGTGKRIFADGTPPRSFELVSTKALHRASSSALTSRTDICAPVPWAHRRKPTSESMGKREDSNEKANLRNQHYLGWLRRPHQTICR